MKIAVWAAVFGLAIVALSVIALWRIFEKAGAPGWASLIPLYNMHVLYRICWQPKFFLDADPPLHCRQGLAGRR